MSDDPKALRAYKAWIDWAGLDPSDKSPGTIARDAWLNAWRLGREDLRRSMRERRAPSSLRSE